MKIIISLCLFLFVASVFAQCDGWGIRNKLDEISIKVDSMIFPDMGNYKCIEGNLYQQKNDNIYVPTKEKCVEIKEKTISEIKK